MFSHCRDINDILLTALSNGIPFTFKSPGCPTKGKGGVQELWRIRLYGEKTVVKEAYTGKGLCHQLATEEIRIPPVTIYNALNKDYRDAEKLSLEAMVETARNEAQEAREAVREELRAAEDTAEVELGGF
jgi:hypothetical protein